MNLPAPLSLTLHPLARYSVPGIMRVAIEGTAPLPPDGPLLLLVNRCSLLDPWLLALAAGRPIQTGVQTPLFWLPGLGSIASRLNTLPLPPQEGNAIDPAYARALDAGHAVVLFVDHWLEPRDEGPRYTFSPAFMELLLATKAERIPVVPALALGTGRQLRLLDNPILARLLRFGARVVDPAWPPVLNAENTLRLGEPVYWRDGGNHTLQEFRAQVDASLGSLF